jgi:spore coat polysaccharide biosynthesis protein SpsF
VATSKDSEDDCIANASFGNAIQVYRGSQNDVLERYIGATADMDDDDFVVRFTADNMFPDGALVYELFSQGKHSDADLVTFGSGFPYGMGATAFRVKLLRNAHEQAVDAYDREHVTPWIIRNGKCKTLVWSGSENFDDLSHLRCTIDSLSDYLRIQSVFNLLGGDPIRLSCERLLEGLLLLPDSPQCSNPQRVIHGRMTGLLQLGTAQLGQRYGVANQCGQPTEDVSAEMLRVALAHNITVIDTARGYGSSETRIGALVPRGDASRFQVVTKLSALDTLSSDADEDFVSSAVEASVLRSCRELKRETLPICLLHRSIHLQSWGGVAWKTLQRLHKDGMITELGVSIYSPEELKNVEMFSDIRHIQFPFNVLDRRWLAADSMNLISKITEQNGAWFTARSVLLQGLLCLPPERWPRINGVSSDEIVRIIKELVIDFGRLDIIDLCFAYVRAKSWVHSLVVGAETVHQIVRNVEYVNREALSPEECRLLEHRLPAGATALVNPSLWNRSISE